MNAADLWHMILAAPADADLRAKYVQALVQAGDRRAEIFSLSAEYKRLRSESYIDRAQVLKPRLDSLIADWRANLSGRSGTWPGEIEFVEGWPVELTIAAADFARHAEEIVATLPVRHLNLRAVSELPAVFEVRQLRQIASLGGSKQMWSDDAIRALAGSTELPALRWLDLSHGGITEPQVEILAASPALRTVKVIDLSENPARDPVDGAAGAGWDWMSGKIEFDSINLPEFGVELERLHGEIPWLHALRTFLEAYPPSRYSF
ncbi:MAG: hypothetical protein QOF71_3001 [Candidatus Eremiobacteraeota bacterium]|jgi:hypothetical protein|nr:hypothetical protein [Candidatus Eremiobacteraeota bacterium]